MIGLVDGLGLWERHRQSLRVAGVEQALPVDVIGIAGVGGLKYTVESAARY